MKKRLIKKKVKTLTDKDLCEYVAYSSGYWQYFSHKEFDKRFGEQQVQSSYVMV